MVRIASLIILMLSSTVANASLRDPMHPLLKERARAVEIVLQAVGAKQGGDLYCVIDGKVYQEGDKVGGYTIISINPGRVDVSDKDDKKYELKV